ncbi:DUF7065 domain-containing protein [Nocardia nova]|uniref:DUF7065 domain-containing protein n=1 Tax=Nocardia nova TaxID=37330 RepID=UPI0018945507|nr:hypothetical protein [Nocardia nova]MBF6149557.1 hypothetical protein [Nocardia nova]
MKPEDDYTHPVGAESNFNESMYFHFHSPGNRISGFVRLANRPNEGRGERTICLYLPDRSVAFGFARPQGTTNEKMAGDGLEFRVGDPFTTLHATFDGEVNLLEDPEILSDPRKLATTPLAGCVVDLTFNRLSAPYSQNFDGDGPAFAPNHYEQIMAVSGSISVDGTAFEIAGTGLRDHSWGPRSWQAPWFYRWLHGSNPNFGFMGAYFGVEDGAPMTGGFVWDGEQVRRCVSVRINTERDAAHVPRRILVELVAADGRSWRLIGDVGGTVPLRHRNRDASGTERVTRILENQTRWIADDGSELFGMSEYLDQIVNDVPVGLDV